MYSVTTKSGEKIEFDIIKSNRKTVSIGVYPDSRVVVKTPKFVSNQDIYQLVETKASWIIKKLGEAEKKTPGVLQKFVSGERFLYLGKEYVLELQEMPGQYVTRIYMEEDKIFIQAADISENAVRRALRRFYIVQAKKVFPERVRIYRPGIKRVVNQITIREQKTRWGSCSSKGNLNFNWKAIMAPIEILDYIVVHELCHLIHMNHSEDFWKAVEGILPDYKERRDWLKKNGSWLESQLREGESV